MARSRNIKPGFFINIELGELKPITRLLFIGLWTVADREGRLKDQPQKIKIQILPYDKCNIDKLLDELQGKGFILRYKANGCRLIQIINFNKHQNPHLKEQASELPAPDMHGASTVQEPNKHGSCPADSLLLIPDSLNLIPDNSEDEEEEKKDPPAPYEKIKELYNTTCENLPKVKVVSETRKKHIKARWKQFNHDLATFEELFGNVKNSKFLNGDNDRKWKPDFDWLMNEANMAKVLEGKYNEQEEEKVFPEHNRRF